MGMGLFLYAATAGAVSGAAGALAIRFFGPGLGLIDTPNERSSHSRATPRGGGAGIPLGYAAASVFSALPYLSVYPGAAIGLLGLAEDRVTLSTGLRLFLQLLICVAALVMLKGVPVGAASFALFAMWVLFACGTVNFYNFMDGINGMAGLIGVISFGALAFYAVTFAGDATAAAACVFIAFSCMGFLPFNLPRANVFMGDAGSMFLGFEFAFMVIHLSLSIAEFLCVAMFLSLFYADCLLTLAMRKMEGRDLMKSHRSHLYQYLCNELGMAHWKVSLVYASLQAALSMLSIVAYTSGMVWQISLFAIVSISALFIYRSVKGLKPHDARHRSEAGVPS